MLCLSNAGSTSDTAHRQRVLRLLAVLEHPDALPPDAALRLSHEIVTLIGAAPGQLRCDPVTADEAEGERA